MKPLEGVKVVDLTTYLAALCRARLVLITPPPKGE